jgi:DNA-directed RNA polymerase specialized sigma24 family protein
VGGVLAPHVPAGQAVQLLIDDGRQPVERALVSVAPGPEQLTHFEPHISFDEAAVVGGGRAADLEALDEALKTLARLDPRKAQVVELRFFGGLSVPEAAEVLKVSSVTVMRDWNTAKAWLYRELAKPERR